MRIASVSRAASLALVIAAALAAWLGAVAARGGTPACAKPLMALPVRLPVPVAITTPCALYTVSRSGLITPSSGSNTSSPATAAARSSRRRSRGARSTSRRR